MITRGKLQVTLALLKPDIMAHPVRVKAIKDLIVKSDFQIVRSKRLQWSRSDAERFYVEHKGRFFYNRLVGFMSSGPLTAMVLSGENAITRWRKLIGPTHSFRARQDAPQSIRARYGISDTRNVTHGSDSEETARKEILFFFPDFNFDWKK